MSRSARVVAGLLGGFLAVTSCGDASHFPTEANANRSTGRSRPALLGLQLVAPVQRATPLGADVTWSFTAGPAGAVSNNPAVGLTITVPAGALSTTQRITVTALAGAAIAYRFEPHLNFARRVRLVQALSQMHASAWPWPLVGGHFAGDVPETSNGLALVTERVPAIPSILTGTTHFDVWHFSGWIVASGNEGARPESSGGSEQ